MIVDDDGQHVGRRAVAPQDDHVVELFVGPLHRALDDVVDDRLACLGHFKPHDIGPGGLRGCRLAISPTAVIADGNPARALLGTHGFELLRGGVAAICTAHLEELLGDLPVASGSRELKDRLAVPIQPEPGQPVEDRCDGLGRGALTVGIFDSQAKYAARMPGVEPVEQRRPCAADMKITRRRGRKPQYRPHVLCCA